MRFGAAQIDEARKLVYVQEILDATRFVGVWMGQTYECRAIPTTASLSAGQTVVCHAMPGTSELIAVLQETGMMFIGGLLDGGGVVYRWNGQAPAPTLAWSFPGSMLASAMAVVADQLYISVTEPTGSCASYLYRWPVADAARSVWPAAPVGAPALVASYSNPDPDPHPFPAGYLMDPANQMAWWDGKLWISHAPNYCRSGYLFVYNPVTGACHCPIWAVASKWGDGGIAVVGDALYWSSNTELYASTDGIVWSLEQDFRVLGRDGSRGFVTDPINDCAYFAIDEHGGGD